MPKYNKKRNTAFLYEALVREAVKKSLNKEVKKRNKIISVLKESFAHNTFLGKELMLFKILLETKGLSTRSADKLIEKVKKEYLKLNTKEIFNEQSALIKKINKQISKNVFSNFVPNYKDLATISQILNADSGVRNCIILEENLLNKITQKTNFKEKNKKSKISNLVVNGFIKKFNDKYSTSLQENQKVLLSKFILSFMDNGVDFKVFLNEEIEYLKKTIRNSYDLEELKKDDNMMIKMKKVLSLLENANTKPVDNEFLQQLLKIQSLAKEIEV